MHLYAYECMNFYTNGGVCETYVPYNVKYSQKKEKNNPDGNFFQGCIKKSEYFMKTYLNNLYIYENYLKNNISKLY